MVDPQLYQGDTYVVLEPDQAERFVSRSELLDLLQTRLADRQAALPIDVQGFASRAEQAEYLLDSSCELDLGPGEFLQWYLVRLEK